MDLTIPHYDEVFESILSEKLPSELVDIIKTFTINFEDILYYHGLVQCNDCGNIWDGAAQCNCWQWQDFNEEEINEWYIGNENHDNNNELEIVHEYNLIS